MEICRRQGDDPPLPPIDGGAYLAEDFQALGMVSQAEGPIPILWTELRAYSDWSEITLDEAAILRRMSAEYIGGLKIGQQALGKAPWGED